MPDLTLNYGLSKLDSGDHISDDGYKYSTTDRDLIDYLLRRSLSHRHTGDAAASGSALDAPSVGLSLTGGTLPANTTIYYVYTLVDSDGGESASSSEASVSTPSPVTAPAAPALDYATTGGTLKFGSYYYALSAYVSGDTNETTAPYRANISVPIGTSTNKVTLTLPSVPAGADGFVVYRRSPGQSQYFYLDTIDMTGGSPPTTYDDDGTVTEDCDRTIPLVNTTNSTNSVTITFPGATPVVPAGSTWKIYRTFVAGGSSRWVRSLLTHVTNETSPGVIDIDYVDTGLATSTGQPPSASVTVDDPTKVDLEDGNEIQNRLPVGFVQAFPWEETFAFSGILEVATGIFAWTCEFPHAEIIGCRAMLGVGSTPASSDVIIDVNKGTDEATPSYSTIYTTQANRPKVLVGEQRGARTVPDVISLSEGESLTVDIDQVGGGATPTDDSLVVTITMLVWMDNIVSDYTWS